MSYSLQTDTDRKQLFQRLYSKIESNTVPSVVAHNDGATDAILGAAKTGRVYYAEKFEVNDPDTDTPLYRILQLKPHSPRRISVSRGIPTIDESLQSCQYIIVGATLPVLATNELSPQQALQQLQSIFHPAANAGDIQYRGNVHSDQELSRLYIRRFR